MTTDPTLQQPFAAETGAQRPLLSALTGWLKPAATSVDPALGYESALPWTLGVDSPAEAGRPRY
jgi:hypothetical protein